ncbi:hypothetical protein CHELA40_14888 [Chelatococcus asaccharovorans]|nr:hypothetical protein CHELA17_60734 [Chelatococcus asaccharovorans]CAH1680573.1 hypothetical protein CHELA40_14888 [Chelatococcus asaccharovorans]
MSLIRRLAGIFSPAHALRRDMALAAARYPAWGFADTGVGRPGDGASPTLVCALQLPIFRSNARLLMNCRTSRPRNP